MIDRLMLGTAGLSGMPYGIEKRVVAPSEAAQVIEHARKSGIHAFDTAPAYGFAEAVLGETLRKMGCGCHVFTKNNGLRDEAILSLTRLKPHYPTMLFHNWGGTSDLPPWTQGATTYETKWETPPKCRWLQVAWNVLRQVEPPAGPRIIARSVLLQGLLANQSVCLVEGLYPYVQRARDMAEACGMKMGEFALRAALQNPRFDYVLVGPTTIAEVDECVRIAKDTSRTVPSELISMLDLGSSPMTDPRNWPK